jgi:hypothetical protein
MFREGLGIKENKMFSSRENIARNSLKQLLKYDAKVFENFILFLSYVNELLQQCLRVFSSAPYLQGCLLKLIHGLDNFFRETIVPSSGIINKSGG